MKRMTRKKKILLGLALFLVGTLLLLLPFSINLDEHFVIRHILLVLGSVNVFLGYIVAMPSKI